MEVLLTTLNAKYIHLNLAIRLLYDLNKDYETMHWKEFTIKEDKDGIALQCEKYDIVCFSCYIWNITQTLEVAQKIKAINPNIKILLGGPEVSYDWHDVIAQDCVDFIITGEGEIPFATFLKTYPHIDLVQNLVRKVDGEIIYHQQSVEFDLKKYEGLNPYQLDDAKELANKVCYIETSRGCPYKCEFCLASLDNKVRYLPIDTIKTHLLYLMQNGKTIKFLDRTFNIKKDFTIEMFQFILDNHRPENVFQFEITADIVHPDIIKFINEKVPKGLFRFEIGIQTVNAKSNLEVSRKQSFEKTAGIIRQLQHKIEMHLDLIVGLPLDYWEDTKFSFEETFKLFPPELQLGFLKFLKGTPVREKYQQYGYEFDPNPPYQIIKSNFLSEEELHKITIVENALEIYWNKKRAFYTLKYVATHYSIFNFFLGLGTYFATQKQFHQYALKDVFIILNEYVEKEFSEDVVLKELVTVDYYLHYKIKPQQLFVEEINKKEKFELLEDLKLNHHKNRYVVLPISFDWSNLITNNIMDMQPQQLIIEYTANEKASIIITDAKKIEYSL
jgi:anaerobic magnesium-protoporphyrin IX monomethyl ester cyclase